MRKFKVEKAETMNAAQSVQTRGCNAIVFVNTGSDVALIDGRPIPVFVAGMQEFPSVQYFGLEGETMDQTFDLTFAAATGPAILVIRKMYV